MEVQIIAADSGADLSSNVELFTIGSRSNPSWGDWIQLRNSNGSMDDLHFDDARFVVQGSFDPTVVGGFAIFWVRIRTGMRRNGTILPGAGRGRIPMHRYNTQQITIHPCRSLRFSLLF